MLKSIFNVPFILASSSPRRIEMLRQIGIPFISESPQIEETRKKGESPRNMVERLSKEKAESVFSNAVFQYGGCIILAADTIVIAPDQKTVLGKPKNKKEAVKMLSLLVGKTHLVLTSYSILIGAREMTKEIISKTVETKVKMRKISSKQISEYVQTGESMDKAGAYAAQGLGMMLIESIRGSYTNVVGLPLAELVSDLEKRFGISLYGAR